ncbi:MAG: hypothetical protein HFH08_07065, partial [Bacilli bacterium]|nr:hypothetical protein [Bacilli bacterium]
MIAKIMNKKRIIQIVSCILFFLFIFFCFLKEGENYQEPLLEEIETPTKNDVIQVDIKGAVKKPGVYELSENSRVKDAIEKSGGLLENAFLNTIKSRC